MIPHLVCFMAVAPPNNHGDHLWFVVPYLPPISVITWSIPYRCRWEKSAENKEITISHSRISFSTHQPQQCPKLTAYHTSSVIATLPPTIIYHPTCTHVQNFIHLLQFLCTGTTKMKLGPCAPQRRSPLNFDLSPQRQRRTVCVVVPL